LVETNRILQKDNKVIEPIQKNKIAINSTKDTQLKGINNNKMKNEIDDTHTFRIYLANRIFLKLGLIIK
jgi:hypothetical protein